VTTDPAEGQKQAEQSTKQPEFKAGDWVRLKAGGRAMRVVAVEDYGNQYVCEKLDEAAGSQAISIETHSRAALVATEPTDIELRDVQGARSADGSDNCASAQPAQDKD